jgi:hypothetical protein
MTRLPTPAAPKLERVPVALVRPLASPHSAINGASLIQLDASERSSPGNGQPVPRDSLGAAGVRATLPGSFSSPRLGTRACRFIAP